MNTRSQTKSEELEWKGNNKSLINHRELINKVNKFLRNPDVDPETDNYLVKNSDDYNHWITQSENYGLGTTDSKGSLIRSVIGTRLQTAPGLGDVFLPPKTKLVVPRRPPRKYMINFIKSRHKNKNKHVYFAKHRLVWKGHLSRFNINKKVLASEFREIYDALNNDSIKVIIVWLSLYTETPKKDIRHRNVIIINKLNKTVERYDPWGYTSRKHNPDVLDKKLMETIAGNRSELWTMIRPSVQCPLSFQGIKTSEEKLEGERGSCVIWAAFWVDLRLSNPDMSSSEMTAQFKVSFGNRIREFERSYSGFLEVQRYKNIDDSSDDDSSDDENDDNSDDENDNTNDSNMDTSEDTPKTTKCEDRVLDCPNIKCKDFCSNTVEIWISGLWHKLRENVGKETGEIEVINNNNNNNESKSHIPVHPFGLIVMNDQTGEFRMLLFVSRKSQRSGKLDRDVMYTWNGNELTRLENSKIKKKYN